MDILAKLLEFDGELVDWILGTSAVTSEEKANKRKVLVLRQELNRQINTLVSRRIRLALLPLAREMKLLSEKLAQLEKIESRIDKAEQVFGVAGAVVGAVAQIIAALV